MYKKITRFFLVIFGMAVIASLCYHEKRYTETIVINEVCTNNFSNCSDEFGNRVSEMINSIAKPEYVNSMLEQIQEEIRPQVLETYSRYYEGIYTEEIYDEKMQIIKNFFEYRYEYLENFVKEERNL